MILARSGVFLVYLALVLAWTAWTARKGPLGRPLLVLLAALTAALVRDRWMAGRPSLLTVPAIAWLFPAAFALTLAQNALVARRRGLRLSDAPLVAFNAIVGVVLVLAALAATRAHPPGPGGAALLYAYSFVQLFLGTWMAPLSTLSWHLPLLLPPDPPRSLPALLPRLVAGALGTFVLAVLGGFLGTARDAVASFAHEPRLETLPDALAVGVWSRPGDDAPGATRAWTLPADHDGAGLPAADGPLVLALRAPDAWRLSVPDRERVVETFLAGAERLAARLRPVLLLPFPDPDLDALPLFDPPPLPEEWGALLARARERVAAASPDTGVALRLSYTQPYSRDVLRAAAPALAAAGPRLQPSRLGPGYADDVLFAWRRWRAGLEAPPEFWVLAAGLSPLAYGEDAQARFVEGCLARAAAEPGVAGVLIDGWRDGARTTGLRPPAAARLAELLRGR